MRVKRIRRSFCHSFYLHSRSRSDELFFSCSTEISVLTRSFAGVPPHPSYRPSNILRAGPPLKLYSSQKECPTTPPCSPVYVNKLGSRIHFRVAAPSLTTLLSSSHKAGLESSSTGSSFRADVFKPVHCPVVCLEIREGQGESRELNHACL